MQMQYKPQYQVYETSKKLNFSILFSFNKVNNVSYDVIFTGAGWNTEIFEKHCTYSKIKQKT